jgi:adenosylcobinamide-GDP ribazoletransferase
MSAVAEVFRGAIAAYVLTEFLLALQFLTIIHITQALPFDERSFGRSVAFFPLVGALLGALVWAVDIVLQGIVPLTLRNLTLVAALALLSRGLHFDGLADSADGLFGSYDRDRRLAIMKDSRIGTFGTLALVGVVLCKVRALDLLPGSGREIALLLGPLLSRWAYVVMGYRAIPARRDGLGAILVRNVFFRELAVASSIALFVTILVGGGYGLTVLALALVLTLGITRLCTARLGGVTGDTFGAAGELVETAVFCFVAVSFSPHPLSSSLFNEPVCAEYSALRKPVAIKPSTLPRFLPFAVTVFC